MSDLDIVNDYDNHYLEAYSAWNPFFPLAERDLRYYLGDQWDEKEKQALFQEGRNQFVFNRIRRNVNLLTGYQRKNRLSSVVVPVENSDQITADQLSQLLLYTFQAGDGYQTISDCFAGAVKTGFNLCTLWMDYRDDPINGDIRFSREPYSGFITDPYFTRLDFSDCGYVIRRKYLNVDQVASLLPKQEKDVRKLFELGWSRDDKFTWLPYQRQPGGQVMMAFDEYTLQKWKNVDMIVDMETGENTEWEGPKDRLKEFLALYPNLQIVKRPKRYIEQHVIVNGQLMNTIHNPFGLDEYPFVPFVGQFDSESDLWELKMQSLVRCQVDPQREMNRRISQMTDIVDSQINSGWIADEDSVINPRSLFQSSQGRVIWRKNSAKPGAIEKIPPAQVPPSLFQLQELFAQNMMEILGVNDAAFGVSENPQESGVLMQMRQSAAVVNLQDVFDNLRYSQKMISKKILKLIQKWSPQKIGRIINQPPSQQFYDLDATKYDVAVQEGVLTDTQRQLYFKQLVDLKQLGVPVSGKMLADAAPLQGKSEFNNQLAQEEQQQAQAAQKQEEVQQQLLQTQSHSAQAKAISDIALSKERFTRAVANMGLQEERNSEAIQNRAQAALDRAKAMKELESMDDERLIKFMQIVQMMEAMNKREEIRNKAEDVMVTEQSEKLNAAFPQTQSPDVGQPGPEEPNINPNLAGV
jgi:hypothetical protein